MFNGQNSETSLGTPEARTLWIKTNQGGAAFLILVFTLLLIYVATHSETFRRLRDGVFLGFVPLASLIIILLCTIHIAFDKFKNDMYYSPEHKNISITRMVICAASFSIAFYVYFIFFRYIGYFISTSVFIPATMYILGVRSWAILIFTTTLSMIVIYGIFTALHFDLPVGPLGF